MGHPEPSSVELYDESPYAEVIARLVAEGPMSRVQLVRLADRGDWRTRALALSALGRLIREDVDAGGFRGMVRPLAVLPGLRRWLPTVGAHGRLVSRSLVNATTDSTFIVRVAAALALGECRDAALLACLNRLQRDRFRPVRLAAALALAATGRALPEPTRVDDCEITPALLAEGRERGRARRVSG